MIDSFGVALRESGRAYDNDNFSSKSFGFEGRMPHHKKNTEIIREEQTVRARSGRGDEGNANFHPSNVQRTLLGSVL
jgi:hypothetical protein